MKLNQTILDTHNSLVSMLMARKDAKYAYVEEVAKKILRERFPLDSELSIDNKFYMAYDFEPGTMAYCTQEAEEATEAANLFERPLARGTFVIVIKGRKVPVGTLGAVVGFTTSKFDNTRKVGIINEEGTVYWTAEGNVQRCLGVPDEHKTGVFGKWVDNENAFRKSKGRQEMAYMATTLEELKGL